MTHFSENDAKSTEQEVYNTFSGYKEQVLASLSSTLADPNAAAYKDDSKEMPGLSELYCYRYIDK